MQKLFSVVRFALLMTVAVFVAQSDWRRAFSGFSLVGIALICLILFGAVSHFIAYRRLCSRLGALHEIFANADRFENLRFLRWSEFPTWALHFWWKPHCFMVLLRGLSCSLRSWWVWQCIYEVFWPYWWLAGRFTCFSLKHSTGRSLLSVWLPWLFSPAIALLPSTIRTSSAPEKLFAA